MSSTSTFLWDWDIKNAPELIIEELTGESLKNNKILINAGGMPAGLRKMKDGLVFFGTSTQNVNLYLI